MAVITPGVMAAGGDPAFTAPATMDLLITTAAVITDTTATDHIANTTM